MTKTKRAELISELVGASHNLKEHNWPVTASIILEGCEEIAALAHQVDRLKKKLKAK